MRKLYRIADFGAEERLTEFCLVGNQILVGIAVPRSDDMVVGRFAIRSFRCDSGAERDFFR